MLSTQFSYHGTLPALKSFSGEDHEVEKIAKHSEKAHGRYSVSVDHVTDDLMMSFCVTDAVVSFVFCSGRLHKSIDGNSVQDLETGRTPPPKLVQLSINSAKTKLAFN